MNAATIALIGVIVGPLVAYITAARKMSGRIGDSTADSLWAEADSIRQDYKERIAELQKRVDKIEGLNYDLKHELDDCKMRNRDLAQSCDRLRRRAEELEAENEMLKRTIRGHFDG